jgi:hypothetical protein
MRRFLAALLGMLVGYPIFAFAGYFAIGLFSNSHFDGSVEASVTAAFVFGPAGVTIGLIAGSISGKRKPASADGSREKVSVVELKPSSLHLAIICRHRRAGSFCIPCHPLFGRVVISREGRSAMTHAIHLRTELTSDQPEF